jgi:transposase
MEEPLNKFDKLTTGLSYIELYRMTNKKSIPQLRMKFIRAYNQGISISEIARRFNTSRNVIKKWIKRYEQSGSDALSDQSRKPVHSPNRTDESIQQKVLDLKEKTHWGRKRLSKALGINQWTVRNVLRQNHVKKKSKQRKVFYPAHWAWEVKLPFALAQVDTKHILDKSAIGTHNYTHFTRLHLPPFQWTFLDAITRVRFFAFSYELTQANGLLFVAAVMSWLRSWSIYEKVHWQEDWGQEFGGDDYNKLNLLNEKYYKPFNAVLNRAPKGRKGYQGRVERSHRTDDEEFYLPIIPKVNSNEEFINFAKLWQYYYNSKRSHFGYKMDGKTPLERLNDYGFALPEMFSMFPILILDDHSTTLVKKYDSILLPGNDLLTPYSLK